MTGKNRISVQFPSGSYFLGQSSPIEVRDSRLTLVKQMYRGQETELDDGLYEISAVLEDGQKYRRLVHLQGGQREEITLETQAGRELAEDTSDPMINRVRHVDITSTRDFSRYLAPDRGAIPITERGAIDLPANLVSLAPLEISLTTAHGAKLKEVRDNRWIFEPSGDLDSVPRADFLVQGDKITISLPLNPKSDYPLNACEVVVNLDAEAPVVRAWILSERTVSSTMQHMLATGYLLRAAKIADDAVDLLRYKYQDPTGALLGALLLNKIGQLEPRLGWVRNLARDFDWLNDGKVLLALLLSRDETQREEALSLVLQASAKPTMFTESYSLMLDLLRRWPGAGHEDQRQQALQSLASMSAYTDWDSMMLCQTTPEGE